MSYTHLQDIIANRRTVKPENFTGEQIPDEDVIKILASANWAPTHGYTEPWRFTVFTGDGLATLGNFLADLDQPDRTAEDFNQMKYDRSRNRPMMASHVIGIGMKRGDNPKIPEIEEVAAVAMAVQNIWLSTHDMGYGGYWSTGALAFKEETRDFLGLGEGDKALGFFYLGKPLKESMPGRRLSPVEAKVQWVRS